MPKSAAILLSRQPLHPCRTDAWVRSSHEAIHWVRDNGYILNTSVGMQTWELLTALGSIHRVRQRVFIPSESADQFAQLRHTVSLEFELDADLTEFVPVWRGTGSESRRDVQSQRDQAIIAASDTLIPVSIRRGGQFARLIDEYGRAGKSIDRDFCVEHRGRSSPLAYRIPSDRINPRLAQIGNRYLIHWTRTFNSAWPTETSLEYYRAIVQSGAYPRHAIDSLINILTTGVIKASSKNMPGNEAVVSFSNRSPHDMTVLIRWRARHRQMSFEPYGVGIDKTAAAAMPIVPVRYYDRRDSSAANGSSTLPEWQRQSIGVKADWQAEMEYRHRGDFSLRQIPREHMILFCHTPKEVVCLEEWFGIRTVPFVAE